MQKKTYRLSLIVAMASLFLCNAPLFASETDDRIESSAQQSYVFKTYLKDDNIKVESKDVEGVKAVKNEMTVAAAAGEPATKTMGQKIDTMGEAIDDASITALVKTSLLYHRSTSGFKTSVMTKDGVVTLDGKAKNAAEKDLASKLVSDVRGVKSVTNNMTVEEAQIKKAKTPKKAAIEGC